MRVRALIAIGVVALVCVVAPATASYAATTETEISQAVTALQQRDAMREVRAERR